MVERLVLSFQIGHNQIIMANKLFYNTLNKYCPTTDHSICLGDRCFRWCRRWGPGGRPALHNSTQPDTDQPWSPNLKGSSTSSTSGSTLIQHHHHLVKQLIQHLVQQFSHCITGELITLNRTKDFKLSS